MRRPQVQRVLPRPLQLLAVVLHLREQPRLVAATEPLRHGGVGPRLSALKLLARHLAIGRQRLAVLVHPEGRKENLVREVGVQRRRHVRQRAEVPVDELRDAPAVVHGAAPVAPRHEERALRKAEVLLHVDEQQMQVETIRRGRGDAVRRPPLLRLHLEPSRVGAVPVLPRVGRVVEPRKRKLLPWRPHRPTPCLTWRHPLHEVEPQPRTSFAARMGIGTSRAGPPEFVYQRHQHSVRQTPCQRDGVRRPSRGSAVRARSGSRSSPAACTSCGRTGRAARRGGRRPAPPRPAPRAGPWRGASCGSSACRARAPG